MRARGEYGQQGKGQGAGVRCFVALDLGPDVLSALEGFLAAVRASGADVRWAACENLHVTLKFLGSIEQERVGMALEALGSLARATAPFEMLAAGVGGFPTLRRPRVIWAGLRSARLPVLARDVEAALVAVGFAPDARAPVPHVTLGRVRSGRGWGRAMAAIEPYGDAEFGASRVAEIVLYRSELRPDGARYTALGRLPFAGGPPAAGE